MQLGASRSIITVLIAATTLLVLALAVSLYEIRSLYSLAKLRSAEPLHLNYFNNSAEAAMAQSSGRDLVVLFGDSRIESWPAAPLGNRLYVANRGIGGETTAQMVPRFQADVLDLSPKVVVIQAGINDLMAAALVPERQDDLRSKMLSNLDDMLRRAKAAGVRVVILPVIVPNTPRLLRLLVWPQGLPQLVTQSNVELSGIAAKHGASFPDANALFVDGNGSPDPTMYVDELHFSTKAYNKLSEQINLIVAEILPPG
jgi:lysophospholipase L1-like esterase